MKLTHAKLRIRVMAFLLSFVFFVGSSFPVNATKVKDLEDKTSDLETELSDLETELNEISSQIKKKSAELKKTREELAVAKGEEEAQYDAMMVRIKYMYENGNTSMLQMLFSSSGIIEFIGRAEYMIQINKYDREQLEELTKLRDEITEKETQLMKDQEYLQSLQAQLDEKISNTSDELSSYKTQLEKARADAKKAAEEAAKPVKPVTPTTGNSDNSSGTSTGSSTGSSSTTTTTGSAVSYTEEDVELLAALIECEAGSSNYEAMLAVGSVVVNRMKHVKYPNTLYGVVYHPGQFTPALNGKADKVIARGVKASCVTAARDALNGKNNVGSCLQFRAASSKYDGIVIGDNVFF